MEMDMVIINIADPLAPLRKLLEKWFYKPDFQAIRIVLGTMAAHYLNIGDPAWLFVVAPPGSGKTTMSILGASNLPQVHTLSSFTEKTFLSGFHGHQQPGLLEKLGDVQQKGQTFITTGNAIFLAKDFTSVLAMRRETRAEILGQLREIHDGQYRKDFGTGVTKIWRGKVTIIAAVTPVLDRHYSMFSVLGERFLQVRWHRPDSEEAGEWALRQQGQEGKMQNSFRDAIRKIFRELSPQAPDLSPEMKKRIAALAEVVAIGRTHIFRNNFGNREIEYVPEAEANTRISKGLGAIVRGVAALCRRPAVTEEDFQDAVRVAFDSIPDNRRKLLKAAIKGKDPALVPMPETVRKRELEELEALEIFQKNDQDSWELTDRVARLLKTAGIPVSRRNGSTDRVANLMQSAGVLPKPSESVSATSSSSTDQPVSAS
jgi:hypothetical protein